MTGKGPGTTRHAAVAAGDPQTADAAIAVLRAGGNAVDAALAGGFAAAVAEPGLTSLGGGGFLLRRSASGQTEVFDFFVDAPGRGLPASELSPHFTPVTVDFSGALQVFHAGYASVAVPGVLPGYLKAHASHGHLPLADVVAPAAALARRGAVLSETQAEIVGLLEAIFALTRDAAGLFLTDGKPPAAGHRLVNDDYARFLELLGERRPQSWADIAEVSTAVAQMRQHDGLLTQEDFDSYQVHHRQAHTVEFLGARLQTNPPPSFGGSIVCRALVEIGAGAPQAPTARALIESLHHATAAQKAETHAAGIPTTSTGTTHISVADSEGTLVSMTTSNGSCSGVLIPETGVQLNNMMGEADLHPGGFHGAIPGTRVASMMAPSLLDLPDGSVVALGSGGSERIRSALLQTIVNLVEGASVQDAVTAPRVHFDGEVIQLEPEVPESVADELADVAPLNRWTRQSLYFGGVNAVLRRANGELEAAGDARRGGVGVVVEL